MRYENQRPGLADQVKSLVQSANSVKTVPHGIKTVEPGEGLQLLSADGAEIFWDWETANGVEQRIQDGTTLIEQTRAALAQTEQALTDAKIRIGQVAAGEIEQIDGHIIINGTVDLPALNVTGEMAGTIARFLDVTARRAIFTEGLTAQDSTLLGTTMAEAINAGTVATRIMTSGLLQTTTAANRGVKIDNAGIRAWDDSGEQTVQLNGRSNYITGEFQTAQSGQRVRLRATGTTAGADFYAKESTTDHLGVWYDTPTTEGYTGVARVMAMQNGWTRDAPGLEMRPKLGTVALAGRMAPESDVIKFSLFTHSAGLDSNAWAQVRFTYVLPFPTTNSARFPFLSVETRNGVEVVATVVSQTESTVIVNIVNKSPNKATGIMYVRLMTINVAP